MSKILKVYNRSSIVPSETTDRTAGRSPNTLVSLRDRLLIAFYQDGNTLVATGKKFGLSTGRVHSIIKEHERRYGVAVLRHMHGRPRNDRDNDDRRALIAFYRDGNTLVATGKKFGFSTAYVHHIITEYEQRYGVAVLRHGNRRATAG